MPGENELWLPELVYPETPGQIDDAYLDRLYRIFERDFVVTKPEWPGLRFAVTMKKNHAGWPSTFWHVITEGPSELERTLNNERASRLIWVRALIDEYLNSRIFQNSNKILWWRNNREKDNRLLIATSDFSYLVVLAQRQDYVLLVTAYPTFPHTVARLKREHEEYWNN